MIGPLRGAVALMLMRCAALHALGTWTDAISPTTQNLWSICNGSGQFVAVGEGGTLLTSADAGTWTAHASGTTRWLAAVTYSPEKRLFVAVGDAGTILTSADAIGDWTPRASGTAQRLNNVAFGGGVFLAVGDNGTALTSPDGITWTLRTTGDTGSLRGLAFGNGVFVVGRNVGENGALFTTADGGATFSAVSAVRFPPYIRSTAIAFSGDGFYVTDTNWVMRGSADGTSWTIDQNLLSDGSKVYGLTFFNDVLLAVGEHGLIRDRFGNLQNYGGATVDWHAIAATADQIVIVGTAGRIAIKYISSASSIGLVDTTFRPVFNAAPEAVRPLADGRVYVAGARLSFTIGGRVQRGIARLNRDGSLDTTFNVGAGLDVAFVPHLPPPNDLGLIGLIDIPIVIAQSDGRVVVWCRYSQQTGRLPLTFYRPLARLNPDGSPDASFQLGPMSSITAGSPPILLADGRWLIANAIEDGAHNRIVTLARFTPDGARDSSFTEPALTSPDPALVGYFSFSSSFTPVVSTMDMQNRIYLATRYGLLDFAPSNTSYLLFRLNPDGTRDTSFAVRKFDELNTLQATNRGLIVQQTRWSADAAYATTASRLVFDGSSDTTFLPLTTDFSSVLAAMKSVSSLGTDASLLPPYGYSQIAAVADGSFFALTRAQRGHHGIVRFNPNGDFDADFSAELALDPKAITGIVPLDNGQLLVTGSFSSIEGIAQQYLARITPNTRAATTRLRNVSVRAQAGSGAGTLIAGFITTGGETTILARGAGPALASFGVVDALTDPQLGFYVGPALTSSNDDWSAGPAVLLSAAATEVNAFPFASGSKDAALLTTAQPGAYTVQLTGKNGATGVALVELYHTGAGPSDARSPRLANLSARANAGAGNDTLIVGFILDGNNTRNVLVRAVGPGLAMFGVTGQLADPVITVYRGATPIAANDNWDDDFLENGLRCREAATAVGAFPLDTGSKDSALVLSLPPGAYTALVTGTNSAAGVALVEIYEVP